MPLTVGTQLGSHEITSARANYDDSPDGERFLMVEAVGQETQSIQLNIVLEWFEDVKRRVPSRKD